MYMEQVNITSGMGLSMKHAKRLTQCANQFHANISFNVDNRMLNAKSLIALMSCQLVVHELGVQADGPDEETAVHSLVQLINQLKGTY